MENSQWTLLVGFHCSETKFLTWLCTDFQAYTHYTVKSKHFKKPERKEPGRQQLLRWLLKQCIPGSISRHHRGIVHTVIQLHFNSGTILYFFFLFFFSAAAETKTTRKSGRFNPRADDEEIQQQNRWAMEIAKGMAHLEVEGIVHRDLAARNVLINDNLVLKVIFTTDSSCWCY